MNCRMPYRIYKQSYADCDTIPGSYDKSNKTVEVIVPDGRMKPSGVRGQKFCTIWLHVGNDAEHTFEQGFRAVSTRNAIRQARRQYKYVQEVAHHD
ncbi:MAG: hypothetical protein Q4P20_10885 [Eubacteriales bacterium]|nr:hypothetical protein [Eubacteriales bacterium]